MSILSPARTSGPAPESPPAPPVQVLPTVVAGALALGLLWWVASRHGAQQAVLLALGLGLGVALFHARFGFTSGWRQLVAVGNGASVRAHALLLGTAATLGLLVLATGAGLFGSTPTPAAGPLGLGLLLGSFLFGVGMQLGGACASGTLFAVGSGQTSILVTLAGFIVGSVLYTWQYDLVDDLPAWDPILLQDHVGFGGAWAVTILVLLGIAAASRAHQGRRNPPPTGRPPSAQGWARLLRGSWPMLVGAVVLGVLAVGVLWVSGGIWGITNAFALWGAKLLQLLGMHPETWTYWRQPDAAAQLSGPLLSDKNTLTNLGIIIGAAAAATAAGVYSLRHRFRGRETAAAFVGGILLGVGARLANGCNIGAYLGGITTGSVSGWVWAVVALAGTWVGLRLRPYFGLGVPRPKDTVC
ncbi:YeeE/YedE family protein [Aeromicrobium sp. CF4.19]|uniref:YeeE/YedE family protein n=1 Tax=Aeromicrobium sp. CF4.19 TaxID=3373082 RepID=UPI003EE76DE9